MPILKTGHFSAQPPVEGAEAEILGLNLIEARAIYDAWRAHPNRGSRFIVAYANLPDRLAGVAELYLRGNRAKWASFCAQAAEGLDKTRGKWLRKCAQAEEPRYRVVLAGRKMGKTHAARQAAERRPLEAVQQAKFMQLCRGRQGWKAYKTEAPGFAGIPDVQVLKPSGSVLRTGKIAFVEMKRPGETPSSLQMNVIEELNNMGFLAFWADDPRKAYMYLCGVWRANP